MIEVGHAIRLYIQTYKATDKRVAKKVVPPLVRRDEEVSCLVKKEEKVREPVSDPQATKGDASDLCK
jgi:hypothetical protein